MKTTHTLKTLLAIPVDELLTEVRKIKGIKDCPRCNDPECAYNNYPDIQDLNYWKTEEDGLTDEEYGRFADLLTDIAYLSKTANERSIISAKAHHRAVAFCAVKLKL